MGRFWNSCKIGHWGYQKSLLPQEEETNLGHREGCFGQEGQSGQGKTTPPCGNTSMSGHVCLPVVRCIGLYCTLLGTNASEGLLEPPSHLALLSQPPPSVTVITTTSVFISWKQWMNSKFYLISEKERDLINLTEHMTQNNSANHWYLDGNQGHSHTYSEQSQWTIQESCNDISCQDLGVGGIRVYLQILLAGHSFEVKSLLLCVPSNLFWTLLVTINRLCRPIKQICLIMSFNGRKRLNISHCISNEDSPNLYTPALQYLMPCHIFRWCSIRLICRIYTGGG